MTMGIVAFTSLVTGKQVHSWYSDGISLEESRKIRDFILAHKSHEVLDKGATDTELVSVAETYLTSLYALFRKLAVKIDEEYIITKASWDSANKKLLPGSNFLDCHTCAL